MRCLVTGGRGMLGTELVSRLRQQGEEAVVWDLPANDVTDIEKTIGGIHQVGPDVIFHLAAWTDVDACEDDVARATGVNFQGTWAVALGAAETGAKLLYVSTDYVFDGLKGTAYREQDRPNPLSAYGRSKLLGEKAVRSTCKQCYVVRTSWLYGRHGRNFVDTIRSRCQREAVLEVVADQVGSPTYAFDLCAPLVEMVKTSKYGLYHLSNAGQCSWYELAREVAAFAGTSCEVRPVGSDASGRRAARPAYSALDSGLFRKKFGHKLRPWQDALRSYLGQAPPAQVGS